MCGIAGILSQSEGVPAKVRDMTNLLRHRGPDDEGFLLVGRQTTRCLAGADTPDSVFHADTAFRPTGRFEPEAIPPETGLALGHRRLSVVDLSPMGHQPMTRDGRLWIVFNGEIYNHQELREELRQAGDSFHSHSDTDVILAAYARWGEACFERFNGMWALALYDADTRRLLLSRDRFGIKPLYLWQTHDTFAFASEIKAFTCLPGWRARMNRQAVHDFLVLSLQDHSRATMFEDVVQLEPGCLMSITIDERQPRPAPVRWYQLQATPFQGNREAAANRFRELFTDAVGLRLRADVDVGSCLSGGLDSSSIVCIANRLLREQDAHQRQNTFSACSDHKQFDEREFINEVVRATDVRTHEVFPDHEDLLARLDRFIWHQDEPFAGTSIYAQWCVFEAARQAGVTVMLDGQGADEQLFGYHQFQRAFLAGLARSGRWSLLWTEAAQARDRWTKTVSSSLRAAADVLVPLPVQQRARNSRQRRRPPAWLDRTRLGAEFPGPLADPFRRYATANELSVELLTGAHLPMLLHWEDRNSMAHSIEARVPFLDYRLVEFVLGLPETFKIHNGRKKAVLREGLHGSVPARILERRDKMGFVTPESVWAQGPAREQFRQGLKDATEALQGIITMQALTLFDDVAAGRADYGSEFWRMIALGRWVRQFDVTT